MKRLFLSAALALVVALGLSSAPASAGTITLLKSTWKNTSGGDTIDSEQLDPGSWQASHEFGHHNTTFKDTFKFKVDLKTALNFDIKLFGVVNNITIHLFDSTGAAGGVDLITPIVLTNAGPASDHYFKFTGSVLAAIVAQPYVFLQVTGAFCSCAKYIITATPLPASLIMLLTALGGMGLVGYRRAKSGSLLRAA